MERALNELNILLNRSPLSRSDIVNIISQIRILLEEHNLKSKYQALNLYCNWTFHPQVSGSIVCYKILEQLTDILIQHDTGNPKIITEVMNILLIPELRNDFIKFCKHFKLPTVHFTEHSNWEGILGLIIYNLIDRPLEFPNMDRLSKKKRLSVIDKRVKFIYESIQNKAKGTHLAVKRFSFFLLTPEILNKSDDIKFYKNTLLWKIETDKEVPIIGPFKIMGRNMVFHE